MSEQLRNALKGLPEGLRNPLIKEYSDALEAGRSAKWETVGLKAGKLCEIICTILEGHTTGKFNSKPSKPKNMQAACQAFANAGSSFPRSVRLQMPRVIAAVYELRNNRDVGHVGGDVDPNKSDGEFFLRSIKWLMAELVRVFHSVDVDEAAEIVGSVSAKTHSSIWTKGDKTRVLDTSLSARQKVLLVLYHADGEMTESSVRRAVEYQHPTNFRNKVLKPMHKDKLIDYETKNQSIEILPPGILEVESSVLRK